MLMWTSEKVVRRSSVKNSVESFLKLSQNLQENTYARVSLFIKLQGLGLQLYWKRDPGTGVFLWICKIFQKTFFIEHLWWLLLNHYPRHHRINEFSLMTQLKKQIDGWQVFGKNTKTKIIIFCHLTSFKYGFYLTQLKLISISSITNFRKGTCCQTI